MKRFNNYLLTHYPLLWNTRLVWVLLVNLVLHTFYFVAGLGAVNVKTLVEYSSVGNVGGETLYMLSVLCALAVLLVWCVFYLRNNAFKSFYRIGHNYLVKEFLIIFLVIVTTISYAHSFEWGVKLRVRSITSKAEMAAEINRTNQAMVYVPLNLSQYFILNSCAEQKHNGEIPGTIDIYPDSENNYAGPDSTRVRLARQRPDAYSYLHYCAGLLPYGSVYNVETDEQVSARNQQWLRAGRRDSVRQSLLQFLPVLDKYGIAYRLDVDTLVNAVFADSLFSVKTSVATERFEVKYGQQVENRYYMSSYDLDRVFSLLDDCQPTPSAFKSLKTTWSIIGYIALSLSVLLLCYRRFSRKAFLVSVIGTLVWAILLALVLASTGSEKTVLPVLLLVLCAVFLLAGLGLLRQKASKTPAAVLLNWHGYLVPFFLMLVVLLVDDYYSSLRYRLYGASLRADALMEAHHPFVTWVANNNADIFLANIFLVVAYMAFFFNRLAMRWQVMPEE